MEGNAYDALLNKLRSLEGRFGEFHVWKPPSQPHAADGFHDGDASFGIVSGYGRFRRVRRSSRERERWYIEFELTGDERSTVSLTADRAAVDWATVSDRSVEFGQEGLVYSFHWD